MREENSLRFSHAWIQGEIQQDVRLVADFQGTILEIGVGQGGDEDPIQGVLLPGLVNAHTHLELSWLKESLPSGEGFIPWLSGLAAARNDQDPSLQRPGVLEAARGLIRGGTRVVSDVCTEVSTLELLSEAGLAGVVQREFLTLSESTLPSVLESARQWMADPSRGRPGIVERCAAHAPYSTAPSLIQWCLQEHGSGAPGSIHLAEDEAELELLSTGGGPWADYLDELRLDWRWWSAPGCSPIEYAEQLGVLGPSTLAVHVVHSTSSDRLLLARTDTPVCLCPRSNLFIGGVLPDVLGLLDAGVRLCLGTDSLASCENLDVLADAAGLATEFPEVAPERWLEMLTAQGADILGCAAMGRLTVGTRPGVWWIEGAQTVDDVIHAASSGRVRRVLEVDA